jgi:hypothetical protein
MLFPEIHLRLSGDETNPAGQEAEVSVLPDGPYAEAGAAEHLGDVVSPVKLQTVCFFAPAIERCDLAKRDNVPGQLVAPSVVLEPDQTRPIRSLAASRRSVLVESDLGHVEDQQSARFQAVMGAPEQTG